MTHDELLAKIKREEDFLKTQCFDGNLIGTFTVTEALRAVVELHKPSGQGLGYAAYCHQCMFNHGSGEIKNHAYPCPTIQAIEKELA